MWWETIYRRRFPFCSRNDLVTIRGAIGSRQSCFSIHRGEAHGSFFRKQLGKEEKDQEQVRRELLECELLLVDEREAEERLVEELVDKVN